MPTAPRVARVQPRGDITRLPDDDPEPVLVVLHWGGRVGRDAVEVVPAWRIATAVNAIQCRWTYAPAGKGSEVLRDDWFDPRDVLDSQPDPDDLEGWRAIVERGVLG